MNLTIRFGYEPMLIATAVYLATRERAAQIADEVLKEYGGELVNASLLCSRKIRMADYTEALRGCK